MNVQKIWWVVQGPNQWPADEINVRPAQDFGHGTMGRVEHWCSPGATLERFDARVNHGPQQSEITSAPSSNCAYVFPVHGFPMFFFVRHAPVSSQKPDSDLTSRDRFLCSVLIIVGVDSAMAIP